MAILCSDKGFPERNKQYEAMALYPLSENELGKLFEDAGLFTNAVVRAVTDTFHFETYEIFKRWMKASSHHDMDDIAPDLLKALMDKRATFHNDGSLTMKVNSTIASKE